MCLTRRAEFTRTPNTPDGTAGSQDSTHSEISSSPETPGRQPRKEKPSKTNANPSAVCDVLVRGTFLTLEGSPDPRRPPPEAEPGEHLCEPGQAACPEEMTEPPTESNEQKRPRGAALSATVAVRGVGPTPAGCNHQLVFRSLSRTHVLSPFTYLLH